MNTEKQIEFDKIKTMWADLAVTEYAKEKIEETEIILEMQVIEQGSRTYGGRMERERPVSLECFAVHCRRILKTQR